MQQLFKIFLKIYKHILIFTLIYHKYICLVYNHLNETPLKQKDSEQKK